MAKALKIVNKRRELIKQNMAAGQSREEATAHADKILGERDRTVIGRDGRAKEPQIGDPL